MSRSPHSDSHRAGWRLRGVGLLLVVALAGMGCAHRVVTRPPDGLDYAFPEWTPGEVSEREAQRIQEAWRAVVSGDTVRATREFRRLLERRPGLTSAEAGLAYAQMRAKQFEAAAAGFGGILERAPNYVPALVGAGALATRSGDAVRAMELYARAVDVAPDDRLVERRLQEATAQVLQHRLAEAQEARALGDVAAAEAAYRAALDAAPEVTGVRVELAELLNAAGRGDEAIAVLEEPEESEPQVLAYLAELRVLRGELEEALGVYRRLLAAEPDDAAARERADEVRRQLEALRMPEEYRLIPEKERVTRADLAALVGAKVTALGRLGPGEARVVVDVDESWAWAEPAIQRIVALDVLSVYPNHTFQPQATVRREELAHAVGRVLDLLEWPEQPAPQLKDVGPSHLFHRGVSRSVAAGLMDVTPAGAFEGWRPVTGSDAVAVIEALAALVGP